MTTPNAELAYRVLDQIDAHPELHRQRWWLTVADCGTAACFAGWACILSGDEPVIPFDGEPGDEFSHVRTADTKIHVGDHARALLGLDSSVEGRDRAAELFFDDNTREDLHRIVAEVFGPRPERAS